jgi:hypothetical protein
LLVYKKKVNNVRKRGQASGSAASTLVGIITLLIIFYILFLPPAERKELLQDEQEGVVPGVIPEGGETIFKGAPGRLAYIGQTEFQHVIPNILLSEERQAKVMADAPPFIIKKGWFSRQFRNVSFYISDLESVDNVFLIFQTPIRRGRLKIIFNGVPVFENTINVQNPNPIPIPRGLLKTENSVEFQVWGFGLIFKRQYNMEDVKIIGEITDLKKQQAANAFSIPEAEHQNIETAYLGFYPICDQNTVGVLDITLNGKVIYSAVPVCENPGREDLFKEDFAAGKNTLGFRLASGNARIEQIKIKTFVRPTKGYSDFFFIKPEVFNAIVTGKAHAILEIEFVDDGQLKEAQTNVNGRLDVLSQKAPKFGRDISEVVRDGNNFIGIEPMADLNIISVDVRVE